MQKNVAGQKWTVFAFGGNNHTTPGDPVTGDTNITAQLSKDGGALAPLGDASPVELGGGYYEFDITQAESDADKLAIVPVSTTPDVLVVGSPGSVYTAPANHPDTVISALGNVDARLAADVVHGGGNQTKLDINNTAGTGPAIRGESVDSHGMQLLGGANSAGLRLEGAYGMWARANAVAAIYAQGVLGNANGFLGIGDGSGHGASLRGDSSGGTGDGLSVAPGASGGNPISYDLVDLLQAIWTHDVANQLMEGARQLRPFVVGPAPSASAIPTNITGAPYTTTDHFKGRIVTINEEAKTIVGSSGSPVILTVSDFVSVPSQNDLGVIS